LHALRHQLTWSSGIVMTNKNDIAQQDFWISDLFVHVPMFNNQIVPKYAKESSKTLKISCQSVNESGSLFISYLTHTCIRHYDAVLYSNCLEPKPKMSFAMWLAQTMSYIEMRCQWNTRCKTERAKSTVRLKLTLGRATAIAVATYSIYWPTHTEFIRYCHDLRSHT